MATLYEIVKEIENFDLQIDEETGEILNSAELDALELEANVKVENICLYIKNLRADAAAYKAEKETFEQRRKQAENKAESLTKYLQYLLDNKPFKTNKVAVSFRKSDQVICPDLQKVDDEYLRYKAPELDKKKIKDAIKAGVKVQGCYIEEKLNIQIK